MSSDSYHIVLLKDELGRRLGENPRYSLRAFAKSLNVDPATLSEVFNTRRSLSLKNAEKIIDRLNLGPLETKKFLTSVANDQAKRILERQNPRLAKYKDGSQLEKKPIDQERYQLIADWQHGAIMELTYSSNFQSCPNWIAKQLGITPTEAKNSFERLVDLNLIKKQDGLYKKQSDQLETASTHISSASLRRKQIQVRKKAIEAIENQPVRLRPMTSLTVCSSPDLIDEAREMIDQFNDKICTFLESGKREQVYTLEIGLFPVQQTPSNHEAVKK